MSIADDSQVSIVLSDYGNQDAAGKVNVLGAGWSFTGVQPNGFTPELAVTVFLEIPSKYRGESFATCLKLLNQAGDPVNFPGPTGPQPLRVQQLVTVDIPAGPPGVPLPPNMPSNQKVAMRLSNGLPLSPNELYRWVFEIDGNDKAAVAFYVAGPPPGPVIG